MSALTVQLSLSVRYNPVTMLDTFSSHPCLIQSFQQNNSVFILLIIRFLECVLGVGCSDWTRVV